MIKAIDPLRRRSDKAMSWSWPLFSLRFEKALKTASAPGGSLAFQSMSPQKEPNGGSQYIVHTAFAYVELLLRTYPTILAHTLLVPV